MRKIKILLSLMIIFITSGCFEKKNIDNIDIKVTAYPIEYITKRLYGEHAKIKSIYPDSMDKDYSISDKLLKDYSSTDLFIFNSNESKENDYVYKMFDSNKKLKIIDATSSLTYNNKIEELWLDPMNYLTIANNIKKGFKEYITTTYLNNEIDTNYENLKVELIQLEADYREMANRANIKTLVVGDDLFSYLSKYGINVISIDDSKNFSQKSYYNAEQLIKNEEVKIIYVKKGEELGKYVKELKEKYDIQIIELDTLYTLSEDDRKNNKNYLDIMYNNLDELKKHLYN